MRRHRWRVHAGLVLAVTIHGRVYAQKSYDWQQVREQFEATNPTLRAVKIGVEEAKAQEITAFLRPNPEFTASLDQINPFTINPYQPLVNAFPLVSANYLHERQRKRELRKESAQKATAIAISQLSDQERSLLFTLRNAFVQVLQQKAIQALTKQSLVYYDKLLAVNRDRFQAGDIAKIDLTRLELQRVQFETDVQTSEVNLRTAKINLLTLLNDRTPVEQFDLTGDFDFPDQVDVLDVYRRAAIETRPDLKAAVETVDKARTDYRLAVANGSTDPTFGVDLGRNPPVSAYFGLSLTIPLRIFDRNQGEKVRTQLDITRNERLREASEAQVYGDVDSAYATINSNLTLLRPYKAAYLKQAGEVRETISFAYDRGGASLLDFLQAQQDYRTIQLSYLNLIGAYLNAASQMNLAVGREVIP
jgi:outer membrane protein, heavy metal efflux system